MFQIKNFRSIVASMINVAKTSQRKLTDFSVGSVARTLMESPAIEIEELYLQMLLGLQDAIPVAIYQAFDFPVVGALPAAGLLTIHFPQAVSQSFTIPSGTVFRSSATDQTFYSTTDIVVQVGVLQTIVTLVAATPGAAGNVLENEISTLSSELQLPSGHTFTNPAFVSGRDSETELVRKTRFIQFVLSLSRGTVQSVKYCAGLAVVRDGAGAVQEYVDRVGIIEDRGFVQLFIRGSSGTPSTSLIANAQKLIDGYYEAGKNVSGYRAAGVEVVVSAMVERAIPVGVSVVTQTGTLQSSALQAAIISSISAAILAVSPGDYLRADALVTAVLSVSGVVMVNLSGTTNVLCSESETLTPGVITVSWLSNA